MRVIETLLSEMEEKVKKNDICKIFLIFKMKCHLHLINYYLFV